MRKFFIVAAKLYGLILAFRLISGIFSLIFYTPTPGGLFAVLPHVSISAVFAVLFLFRAEMLADLLHIPSDVDLSPIEPSRMLYVGTKLLGLYLFVVGLPTFFRAMDIDSYDKFSMFFHPATGIASAVSFLAVALLYAIKPDFVLSLLSKGEKAQGKNLIVGGLALVTLLFSLCWGVYIVRHRTSSWETTTEFYENKSEDPVRKMLQSGEIVGDDHNSGQSNLTGKGVTVK